VVDVLAPAGLDRRMAAARAMMAHPRVVVSDIEARLGTRYTAATLAAIGPRYPGVRFVWLMGADNLAGFHRWENWRRIMETIPIGVFARPGDRIPARTSVAAACYRSWRIPADAARLLPDLRPPAWCFVNIPMVNLSSTDIRSRGEWVR
jgi:nicotinate-nucleotide adenylyltransferase